MGPNSIAILSIVAFITAAAADVTLYNVVGPTPAIYSEIDDFSAVGVDAGGSTTYIGTIIQSLVVQPEGSTTRTLLSTPTTFGATFVEDKTGLHDPNGLISCTFSPGGAGACAGGGVTIQAGGGPGGTDAASISALTMTGSATPWTTIKDPGPTATPTPAPNNGAGGLHSPSIFAVICLSVVYFLL